MYTVDVVVRYGGHVQHGDRLPVGWSASALFPVLRPRLALLTAVRRGPVRRHQPPARDVRRVPRRRSEQHWRHVVDTAAA